MSENGLPDGTALWPGPSPGAAAALGAGVSLARHHDTVRLGQLLAPYGVRYIVVVDSFAPSIPGLQTPVTDPPPADLMPALGAQIDLRSVISQGGFEVFANADALPLTGVRVTAASTSSTPPTSSPTRPPSVSSVAGASAALGGWTPALHRAVETSTATGRVPAGTVLDAVAPASRFTLTEGDGRVVQPHEAFGYAPAFTVARPATVTISFSESAAHVLEVVLEVVLWVVALAAVAGRRRWLDWWWGRRRRAEERRMADAGHADAAHTDATHTDRRGHVATWACLRPSLQGAADGVGVRVPSCPGCIGLGTRLRARRHGRQSCRPPPGGQRH